MTAFSVLALSFFVVSITLSIFIFTEPLAIISALYSHEVRFAILLSVFTATTATVLALTMGVPAAYFLSRNDFRGKKIIDALINIPIALPPVAIGAALLIFFTNTPVGNFINSNICFVFEIPGIIVAQFIIVSPYIVRLMKPVFERIDVRYEKIARTFGYSSLETFLRVSLPLAKTGIFSAAVMAWARAIGEFGAIVMLAGATRLKTETLPIAVYLNLAQADLGKAMAIILVLLIIAMIVFVTFQWKEGVAYD